jgi:mono/diheme cytochrome c family protein
MFFSSTKSDSAVLLRVLIPVCLVTLCACRSTVSEKPPVHLNQNMDFQERFDPQEANDFFADGRSMRRPVPGTVPRGFLREDVRFYEGISETGEPVRTAPIEITMEVLKRGQRQYNIYCAVCHGVAGDGLGPIMTGKFGYVPAPTYHSDALRAETDGYFYGAITNGIRTMPSYAQQVAVADRWAIVAYIRALQKSQSATEADIPESVLAEVQQRGSANITIREN